MKESLIIGEQLPKYLNVAKAQPIYHDHLLEEVINNKEKK
jgi:hypothetical protein